MHMKVVESRKGEGSLGPFHCGRKQLGLSKLNGLWDIVTSTIFDTNMVDFVGMNNNGVTSRSRETVPAPLTTMSQVNCSAKGV